MARVEINDVVQTTAGVAVPGASIQVNKRTGGAATIYQAEVGASTLANPLTTDSAGRIEGWLLEGSYDLVISGSGITTYTQRFEAAKGGGVYQAPDPTGVASTDRTRLNEFWSTIMALTWWPRTILPAGEYKSDQMLTYPVAAVIEGAGRMESVITFTVDLGAGNHMMRPSSPDYPSVLRNFACNAPQVAFVPGVIPNNMMGIRANHATIIENMQVSYSKGGVTTLTDHVKLIGCSITNNYFNFYQEPNPVTIGNHSFVNCELTGAYMASIGMHRTHTFSGNIFAGTHIGYAPYGFYREAAGATSGLGQGFIDAQTASDFWLEAFGNGIFFDANAASGVADSVITNSDFGQMAYSFNSTYKIAASPIRGIVVVGAMRDVRMGPWEFAPGYGVFNDALIELTNPMVSQNLHFTELPLPTGTGAGQRIFTNNADIRTSTFSDQTGDANARGRLLWLPPAAVKGNLYARNGRDVCAAWAAGSVPAGFAACATAAGDVVPIIAAGYVPQMNAQASIAQNKFVKADDTNIGKVAQATGPTDGTVVGISLTPGTAFQGEARVGGV